MCDILLLGLDYCGTPDDDAFLKQLLRSAKKVAVILSSSDDDVDLALELEKGSDDAVATSAGGSSLLHLRKPCSFAAVHMSFESAERIVLQLREENAKMNQLKATFNTTKRGDYRVVRQLGAGAFGEVFEVEDVLTGGHMAMKQLRIKVADEADAIVDEIRTMTSLSHRNVIQYLYCDKVSERELKIFMEIALGGTLQEKVQRAFAAPGAPGLMAVPVEETMQHLRDVLLGLEYLHNNGFVHADIKTANALLSTNNVTKLSDFGTSKKLKAGEKLYTMSGTPAYMAPEVIAADPVERHGYDFKADMWSFGCVALEMVTGKLPFAYIDGLKGGGMAIINYVSNLHEDSQPDISPLFDFPLLFEVVRACLEVNPEKRPTATQLLKFSFFCADSAASVTHAEKAVKKAKLILELSRFAAFTDSSRGATVHSNDTHLESSTQSSRGDDVRKFSLMVKKNFFADSSDDDEGNAEQ
jgi:serine/threonine protein kinase